MENLSISARTMDLKGMGWQKVDKINLAQESEKWRMFVGRNMGVRFL